MRQDQEPGQHLSLPKGVLLGLELLAIKLAVQAICKGAVAGLRRTELCHVPRIVTVVQQDLHKDIHIPGTSLQA